MRLRPDGGKLFIVARDHDVGEAKRDERDARPLRDMAGERLARHLRQRVRRGGNRVVVLVHRGIPGRGPCRLEGPLLLDAHAEGQAERCLARRPHHAAQPEARRSVEDVEVHGDVGVERDRRGGETRRGNVGQVDDGVRPLERLECLSVIGQICPERSGLQVVTGRRNVGRRNLVCVLRQIPDHRPTRLPVRPRHTYPPRARSPHVSSNLPAR